MQNEMQSLIWTALLKSRLALYNLGLCRSFSTLRPTPCLTALSKFLSVMLEGNVRKIGGILTNPIIISLGTKQNPKEQGDNLTKPLLIILKFHPCN